jgi:hypothetical protein
MIAAALVATTVAILIAIIIQRNTTATEGRFLSTPKEYRSTFHVSLMS